MWGRGLCFQVPRSTADCELQKSFNVLNMHVLKLGTPTLDAANADTFLLMLNSTCPL
jgi:hypothetical protein